MPKCLDTGETPVLQMKLLLTTDTIGGVWTYAMELARALAPRDVQIALATMGDPLSPDQRRQVATLDHVTVFESQYKLEWQPDPWSDVHAAGQWLLEIEYRFHPDVVHLNGYAHGALPWRSPALVVAHSCVCSWWQAVKGEPAPPEWDRYRAAVRDGLRSVDAVVAPSAAMLAALEQAHGPLPPSRVIYNGRDSSPFRASWKEPFIFSAGRMWDDAKNLAAMARVAPQLSWPVYVAGDGADGLTPENLHSLGRLDPASLAHWLSRASIYALPARYEPFGLSILEAALSGCALVLGDIPSLHEIWSNAALYVAPDDDAALAKTLDRLITDPDARRDLAARAAARARRYTVQRMGRAYLDLYRQLSGGSPDIFAASNATTAERICECGS